MRGLAEVAWVFLKLGTIGFGGPAAHIALMEDELVRRRQWLSRESFLDLLAATHLIPGPNSTEMAIHIGHRRAGWPGLLVAGTCFILPAVLIVGTIAWLYVQFGSYAQFGAALAAIQPVMIAVIVQAMWGLARTAVKNLWWAALALAAFAANRLGMNELVVLGAAAVVAGLVAVAARRRDTASGLQPGLIPLAAGGMVGPLGAGVAAGATASAFGLWPMFLVFLKIGSVLFGSGYVLLAFLRADFVERLGWLSEKQLLDAVAVGQITPGPVFTTATFIGYLLGGAPGAALATIGIFLPSFLFVAASGPLIPAIRRSRTAGAVLDGLVVGSLAVMAAVAWPLARVAIVGPMSAAIAIAAGILLIRFRVNSAWLVLGAGLIGVVRSRLG